jgi:hypothetical protein
MKKIMKIQKLIGLLLIFFASSVTAQSTKKTEQFKIYGNCEMCKSTIEKAGFKKGSSKVEWDEKSKLAAITYEPTKETADAILKRIALAGYDNELFLAPDEAYAKLPSCCKYERTSRKNSKTAARADHHLAVEKQESTPLETLFSAYFDLKNAFIQSDAKSVTLKATEVVTSLSSIKMAELSAAQHDFWMRSNQRMRALSQEIAKSDKIETQRTTFKELSQEFYQFSKLADLSYEVYWQHCPMYQEGADWLSREATIKNPYYGSQMLTCGKTTEIIK